MGDLKADPNTANGKQLENFMQKFKLWSHIDTRITETVGETSSLCLDQILTNAPNFIQSTTVLSPVSTDDHCTTGATLQFNINQEQPYNRHVWL